ncbi:copper resistance protein B [Desulfopila aestuarii]|uniref:Copper resistance protein B n=1 Tax=Desulfopila aestuarii DSM 18488 TaxID=1121416 RepID=A0A1M7YJL2_9BACT|nr:copper resistance protein B [Desulfopila aestuarii]SHO52800.1 copper resistance protein B [Desulfopila aestuarii DSM 18488]
MKHIMHLLFPLVIVAHSSMSLAGDMDDDPLLGKVMLDQLELRTGDSDATVNWSLDGWLGRDLDKLWLKTKGDYERGSIGEANLQALYSRAIAPFWDLQVGWRGDLRPEPVRNWLAVGVKGLAPYFFDLDAALFLGESGRSQARIQAEYELLLTQRLILVPELELTLSGKDDPETATGSGLSTVEAGLRIRYEIRREFAPYLGVSWTRLYGQTADYAVEEGDETDQFQIVVGIRCWL